MSESDFAAARTPTRLLRIFIKAAITLGLLAVLVQGSDLEQLGRAIRNVSWTSMATGIAILLLLSLAQASRWQAILKSLGTRIRYRRIWVLVLIGFFFSQLLPSSIGGDVARVWKLRQAGAPISRALNSVVLDRITALMAAALITVAGAGLLFDLFPGPVIRYLVIGTALAISAGLSVLFLMNRMPSALHLLQRLPGRRVRALVAGMVNDARASLLDPRTLSLTLTLSCLIHISVSGTVWLIATDIGAHVGLLSCMVLVPLVILVSMLPISIAGWGVREGAMVIALGAIGVDRATALTTSVLFGLALAATGIPGGLLWLRGRRHGAEVA